MQESDELPNVPKRLLENTSYSNYNMDNYNSSLVKQTNEPLPLNRLEEHAPPSWKNNSHRDNTACDPRQNGVCEIKQDWNFNSINNNNYQPHNKPYSRPDNNDWSKSERNSDFTNFQPYRVRKQEVIKTDRGRLMLFIDGSNLFYTAQMMGLEIDYLKLVDTLVGRDKCIRVNFYAGVDTESQNSTGWQYFMKRSGFRMITKPLQIFPDGTRKANCDVEIAVDMMQVLDSYDTAILLSGDGDLSYVTQTLVNKGKQVEIVGYKGNTSDSLLQACDRFIELDSIRANIKKH
jgi:uncharacterized LabA/DUF88 family protein